MQINLRATVEGSGSQLQGCGDIHEIVKGFQIPQFMREVPKHSDYLYVYTEYCVSRMLAVSATEIIHC
jgi:hypothetical protein